MSKPFDYFLESLRSRVYEVARKTPLERASALSEALGNQVWLKREDLQQTFSFKLRGAYNCIAHRLAQPDEPPLRQVVTASAGNHAQGVALAASKLGLSAVIVMPVTTPQIKIDSVKSLGGKVVLHGDDYDTAFDHALTLVGKNSTTLFVHPYDDPWVISGQGTIALEIISQHPGDIEAVFVPVGGGGLLAGVCACLKKVQPSVRIIGVEPDDACALYHSLRQGRRTKLASVGLFADGVAVRQVGARAYKVIKDCVDDVITVSVDEMCNAIGWLYKDTRSVAEPAGALATAGLRRYVENNPGLRNRHLISLVTGANINFSKLRYISERIEYSAGGEKLFAITIPEHPGSFRKLAQLLRKNNITEFNYRNNSTSLAHVFCGMHFSGRDEGTVQQLRARLEKSGFDVMDMTGNDLAKTHIRYTVGGRLPGVSDEYFLRMEFDEKPGALLHFLEEIPAQWNISLFHYRNHGSATGQVLCGLQVPAKTQSPAKHLSGLGYRVVDETANPVCALFLL